MKESKISLITEDKNLSKELKIILQRYGYGQIETGSIGDEGLRHVRQRNPELVILDASTKPSTKLKMIQFITEDELAAVVLLLKNFDEKLIKKAKDSGIIAFILKPVTEKNLIPTVESSIINFNKLKELKKEKEKLEKSLERRKLVEKAKGIIMKKYNLSEDEAYRKLQKRAMDKSISLKELANAIILADET